MQNINKILIIEVAGIGDVVMSIPSLRALRKKFPQAYIAALVSPRASPLLERCPYINEVFTFTIDNLWSTILKLRSKKFDAAINLYRIVTFRGNVLMRILFKAIRPALSVGRYLDGKGNFYNVKWNESLTDIQHEVKTKLKVVGLLGATIEDKKLELWLGNEDEVYALALLDQFEVRENDFLIGINPNAFQRANLWFEDRFAQIADILIEKYQAKAFFFGSSADKVRVNRIISFMRNGPINLAGKLTLNQYVSLIRRIKLFITLDSGPMHIASVFKIPTIALFGPGQPQRFRPYLNEKTIILQKKVGCNPCNKKLKCRKALCMKAIKVRDVLNSLEKLIKNYEFVTRLVKM